MRERELHVQQVAQEMLAVTRGDELDRLREAVKRVRELCDQVETAADEYARTEGIHTDGAVDVDAIRQALGEEAS